MGWFINCTYCDRRVYWSQRHRTAYEVLFASPAEHRAREASASGLMPEHECPGRPASAPVMSRQATPEELERIRAGAWRPEKDPQ